MQYYVRINSASKTNPCHIIDIFPVLLPVSHIYKQQHATNLVPPSQDVFDKFYIISKFNYICDGHIGTL